jgi:hypothetical protein
MVVYFMNIFYNNVSPTGLYYKLYVLLHVWGISSIQYPVSSIQYQASSILVFRQ